MDSKERLEIIWDLHNDLQTWFTDFARDEGLNGELELMWSDGIREVFEDYE